MTEQRGIGFGRGRALPLIGAARQAQGDARQFQTRIGRLQNERRLAQLRAQRGQERVALLRHRLLLGALRFGNGLALQFFQMQVRKFAARFGRERQGLSVDLTFEDFRLSVRQDEPKSPAVHDRVVGRDGLHQVDGDDRFLVFAELDAHQGRFVIRDPPRADQRIRRGDGFGRRRRYRCRRRIRGLRVRFPTPYRQPQHGDESDVTQIPHHCSPFE